MFSPVPPRQETAPETSTEARPSEVIVDPRGTAIQPSAVSLDSDASAPPAEDATSLGQLTEFQRTLAGLTPRVYVTPVFIGVNVLVFVLMTASGISLTQPTIPDLLRWGADFGPKAMTGEWWRLLTCIFVHIGIIHILLNMWVLATAGPLVERMVGNIGFLLLYLVAGLSGSLASLFWNPLLVSAGASGAIFGIYGALLGLLLRGYGSIPAKTLAQLRNSGLGFLFYNLLYGMMQATVDSAAHIGGLTGGFLCGLVLSQPFTPQALAGRPVRNALVSGLGVFLVITGAIGLYARHADTANLQLELNESKVQHGNLEVFYLGGATKAEADRLGTYLVKSWGASGNRQSVQLKKTAGGYQVRIVVKKEFQNDQETLKQLGFDGARISRDVFDGTDIEVHACDQYLKTLQAFPLRADIRYGVVAGKAEVFFAKDVNNGDAQRLAKYLASILENEPAQASFKLARRGAVVEVHMVVAPESLKDPAVIAEMREVRNDIAVNVFKGSTVEMHLCDELFNVVRVLKP